MHFVGIDLSGPSNTTDTAVAVFKHVDRSIHYERHIAAATDAQIRTAVADLAGTSPTVVGIDAPLSYNPGGGDRKADTELRRRLIDIGLPSGTVMAPTMTRMAYLTLRGVVLSRDLAALRGVRVMEVHPGGVCALRGAPIEAVRRFSCEPAARVDLLHWMERLGVVGMRADAPSSHLVAACAAALAAWKWAGGEAVWSARASPPEMPFDFAC